MIKKYSSLMLICLGLLTAFTNVQTQEKRANSVSVKKSSNGYRLSINANNLPLEKLLDKFTSQFPLRVITYGVDISQPLTINFKDLPLERGIKLLLKESGINNHFIQYQNDEKSRAHITVLTLLGNGTKTCGKTIIEEPTKKSKEQENCTSTTMKSHSPEDEFAEKITFFKKRYEWADEETGEMAEYLLELMPESVRNPGLDALMDGLDRTIAVGGKNAVDENDFFQALENTVPSYLAPVMMDSIKQYSQRYKTETLRETDKRAPNEIYRGIMRKSLSNGNNNLIGDSSYDYESN